MGGVGVGGWHTRVGGGAVWECSPAGVLVSEQRKKEPPRDSAKQHSVMLLLRKILSLRAEVDVAKESSFVFSPPLFKCT